MGRTEAQVAEIVHMLQHHRIPYLLIAAACFLCRPALCDELSLFQSERAALDKAVRDRSPYAFALLGELTDREEWLPDAKVLEDLLARIAASKKVNPLLRSHARLYHAWHRASRGDLALRARVLREEGFPPDLWVIGPFDNLGNRGMVSGSEFDKTLATFDPKQVGEGKEHTVRWRLIRGLTSPGAANLERYFSDTKESLAYLAIAIELPKAQWVALRTGSTSGMALFVNGRRVAFQPQQRRGYLDQDATLVYLPKGFSRLVLKVGSRPGEWGAIWRVTAPDGSPIKGLRFSSKPDDMKKHDEAKVPKRKPALYNPVDDARARVKSANDATRWQRRYELAELLRIFRPFDTNKQEDRPLFEALVRERPTSIAAWRGLAWSCTDDDNCRRRAYRTLLGLAKKPLDRAGALMGLYWHYKRHRLAEKALHYLQRAAQLDPGSLRVIGELALSFRAVGLHEKALALLMPLQKRYNGNQRLLVLLGDLALNLGDRRSALEHYKKAATLYRLDVESRRRMVRLYADALQLEPLLALYDELRAILVHSNKLALEHSQLLFENGRHNAAIARLAEQLRINPDSPDLLEKLGSFQHRMGKTRLALATWKRALELFPQNTRLKDYTAFLEKNRPLQEIYSVPYATIVNQPVPPRLRQSGGTILFEQDAIRVKPNGLADRFHQIVVRVTSNKQREQYQRQTFYYVPGQQSFEFLTTEVHKPGGDTQQPTSVRRVRPFGKIGGVYQDVVVFVVSFANLEVGDTIHIRYRKDDITRENMFGRFFGHIEQFQTQLPKLRHRFVVEMPAKRPLFAYEKGVKRPTVLLRGTTRIYTWEIAPVDELTVEPSMPGYPEVGAYVNVSTFRDWAKLTKWYHRLVHSQFELDDEMRRHVDALIKGVSDERKKVERIHNWVVQNTRYVGIELGVHSFKPYHVVQIFRRKYGDCKDKATLLIAMLRYAGIEAEFVMIRTRDRGLLHSYPATLWAFNHAIAYLPKLDLYLDGTAEFSGTGEVPYLDQGALAVRIDANGNSHVVTTPVKSAANAIWKIDGRVRLSANGNATFEVSQRVSGSLAPILRQRYQVASQRRSQLERAIGSTYPGAKLSSAHFSDTTQLETPVQVSYRAIIPQFVERDATGLRHPLFLFPMRLTEQFAQSETRVHDLLMKFAWQEQGRVVYDLPRGYRPRAPRGKGEVVSRFGVFRYRYETSGTTVRLDYSLELRKVRILAKEYPEFRRFCLRVDRQAERKQLLIR
ncbi:MAG: DUF3857 domain-containing protein [Myxococcales bacterium]|nr:DUF3857 domain-containing protein [Myxococcales bacterium]